MYTERAQIITKNNGIFSFVRNFQSKSDSLQEDMLCSEKLPGPAQQQVDEAEWPATARDTRSLFGLKRHDDTLLVPETGASLSLQTQGLQYYIQQITAPRSRHVLTIPFSIPTK